MKVSRNVTAAATKSSLLHMNGCQHWPLLGMRGISQINQASLPGFQGSSEANINPSSLTPPPHVAYGAEEKLVILWSPSVNILSPFFCCRQTFFLLRTIEKNLHLRLAWPLSGLKQQSCWGRNRNSRWAAGLTGESRRKCSIFDAISLLARMFHILPPFFCSFLHFQCDSNVTWRHL